MNKICPGWAAGDCNSFVFSSELRMGSPFVHILDNFYLMSKCEVFHKIWWSYQDLLSKDHKVTQEQFVNDVWAPSIRDCFDLVTKCSDGSAVVAQIVNYFPSFNQGAIQEHLLSLREALNKSISEYASKVPSNSDWILFASKKIDTYQRFKHYQETAVYLLNLKTCLKLTGNFDLLESIAEEVCFKFMLHVYNMLFLFRKNLFPP